MSVSHATCFAFELCLSDLITSRSVKTAMGVLFILQCSANSPWVNGGNVNWTIPFFALSLGLNILLTLAIALRLVIFRRHVVSVLGKGYGSQYTSIAAMIVESAALFSIFSILFIVPFALNKPLNNIFVQSLNHVQACITSGSIGSGWLTSLIFNRL